MQVEALFQTDDRYPKIPGNRFTVKIGIRELLGILVPSDVVKMHSSAVQKSESYQGWEGTAAAAAAAALPDARRHS